VAEYLKKAKEKPEEDIRAVQDAVREILTKVKKEGESAVRYYAKTFDKWEPKSFKVSQDEMRSVKKQLPASEVADIDFCQAQIRNFAQEQMKRLWTLRRRLFPACTWGRRSFRWPPAAPMFPAAATRCWVRRT
jgi:sulfopropanediol 3-dehydrogenase